MIKRIILLITVFSLTISCCGTRSNSKCVDETAELTTNAPIQFAIDGRTYHLETYLYRNFMPSMGPPKVHSLISILYLTADGEEEIDHTFSVTDLIMTNGELTWEVNLTDDDVLTMKKSDYFGRKSVEAMFPSKLEWKPGKKVNVILTVIDENGQSYRVMAENQEIKKVS